ncbi:hypothetical protein VFPPC_00496 [Pochonia chlamydosporia 170]|uniref:Uncharacterized protein n=1 Tax=Pochonia chlamydosporia 170 TaxID=1380566 RepID=A0A179G5C2_METCM|nr:hypothetical protein VFPPC_00496 [Pochonia chlamydosporia 170]OAQ72553.2 hypothetical protein VFPPC_00496 [Pochonia chlamydosporia 170]
MRSGPTLLVCNLTGFGCQDGHGTRLFMELDQTDWTPFSADTQIDGVNSSCMEGLVNGIRSWGMTRTVACIDTGHFELERMNHERQVESMSCDRCPCWFGGAIGKRGDGDMDNGQAQAFINSLLG